MQSLATLKELESDLLAQLKHYEDRDPTVLKALGEKIDIEMERATRWGSNLAALRCRSNIQVKNETPRSALYTRRWAADKPDPNVVLCVCDDALE
jgi:hypothetical protein